MAQREKGGRVVFIGNIPYGVSEEQIMDIFGRAGQVVNFRLVYDKETGQPKGFGFLEYTDTDAAASAVRNLNDFDLKGRTLRVDYSNDNRGTSNQNQTQDNNRAPPTAHFDTNQPNGGRPDASAVPPLPQGADLPPGVQALDAISRTINNVPTPQLIDFLSQIKGLCASNPAQATALLTQAPQLAYAVFQAMLLLDLVDVNIAQQLPPPGYPPPMPTGYPPGYGPQGPTGYAPTPPQQPMYQPPPQQAPPPQLAHVPEEQKALLQQLFSLSRAQIDQMPEDQRAAIVAARNQYAAQYGLPLL
ncbi:uncharacterized protein MYCFIDRAFT_139429 [Pseudocercospora fijiensis CIRAD86]|uniref:RRM domain-containing protein n=1 Tax=Pseudocercospora fijiensis (strain CIRAD86) TaxID=383855 RepID=M2YSU5_PSEFD|nr:uncharacterized protein MYCFIDRAFT_139429 [Pseudocercospora fijiensis CIRAD86]EME80765.1 hypothetical protein MYCFIDRAFT_139429 [Pseudocercospora fijiensis CIRAD86]